MKAKIGKWLFFTLNQKQLIFIVFFAKQEDVGSQGGSGIMICVCLTFHKFTETEKVQNNIGVESNAAEFGNNRSKTFRKQSILFEKYKNIGYR